MSKPGEHKTVQARLLAYAEAIDWTIVSREAAGQRWTGMSALRWESLFQSMRRNRQDHAFLWLKELAPV